MTEYYAGFTEEDIEFLEAVGMDVAYCKRNAVNNAVAVELEWGQAKQRVRHVYLCAGGHRHRWLWVARICNWMKG